MPTGPGLIGTGMQQPASQQTGAVAQPAGPQAEPDKKSVERVVIAALKIIHDPKISPQILKMMKDAGDPVQALAKTTLMIMRELYKKSNQSIPLDVLGRAGIEVMNELAMLANGTKMYNITPEIFQQAVQAALEELKQGAQAAPAVAPAQPAAAQAEQPMAAV